MSGTRLARPGPRATRAESRRVDAPAGSRAPRASPEDPPARVPVAPRGRARRGPGRGGRDAARALYELTKPGITAMVLVTAAAGYLVGAGGEFEFLALTHLLIGVGLAAAGTNALNQVLERELDAAMDRTRARPLPSGRLSASAATGFAVLISAAGIAQLGVFVNALTAWIVALTLVAYVFVYTPLKRWTPWATEIGAVPGALPIVAGWTAATGALAPGAWALFAILFLWQLPHFFALAWLFRRDYRRAGFAVVSVGDYDGRATASRAFAYGLALIPVSIVPALLGDLGWGYAAVAFSLSLGYAALAAAMLVRRGRPSARRLFFGSIAYLPAVLAAMAVDRLLG